MFVAKTTHKAYTWTEEKPDDKSLTLISEGQKLGTKYAIPAFPWVTVDVDGKKVKYLTADVYDEFNKEWVRADSRKVKFPAVLFQVQFGNKTKAGGKNNSGNNGLYWGLTNSSGNSDPRFVPLWLLVLGVGFVLLK